MARRITVASQATEISPPLGHLSTKSSVYSPVSMSRMSQDMVYNHMKSHYERISSAKACVDTSAPKCMKLTIKEKDRIRKNQLLASNTDRPTTRYSSKQSDWMATHSSSWEHNISESNHYFASSPRQRRNESCISKKSSINNRTPKEIFTENRVSTQAYRTLKDSAVALHRLRKHEENMLENNGDLIGRGMQVPKNNYGRFENHKILAIDRIEIAEPNTTADTNVNIASSRPTEERNPSKHQFVNQRSDGHTQNDSKKHIHADNTSISQFSEAPTSSYHTSLRCKQWSSNSQNKITENGLEGHTSAYFLPNTSTPTPTERELPNISLSTITFSYKSPPARRKPTRKKPEEIIWTEEQKYLQFLAGVTSDVLARGICSNRVINKVFESHIEKRKEDLDENNLREMINQLKDDLGITED